MKERGLISKLRDDVGQGLLDVRTALEKYNWDYERAKCFLRHKGIAVNFKLRKMNPDTGKFYTYAEYSVAKEFGDIVNE